MQFLVIKTLHPDSLEMLVPDPYPDSINPDPYPDSINPDPQLWLNGVVTWTYRSRHVGCGSQSQLIFPKQVNELV
jgi:hypothetical protein